MVSEKSNIKIFYEVRWLMYQYNSGKGDNGEFTHKEKFDNLGDAQSLVNKIKIFMTDKKSHESEAYKDFIDHEVWSGYITSYGSIFKITEEKL